MNLSEILKKIPIHPGCYLMKNKVGEIIYIGKAKNLKKRVSSYFQKKHTDEKTLELVGFIADIDYIVTDNEVEALLLEQKLVRQHKPKYNIDLKDSVKYAFLKITDEPFPRVVTTRMREDVGKYFGPYTSGKARSMANKLMSRIFKIRICNPMPQKACLLFHLGRCTAPCIGNVNENEYGEQIKKAEMFLKGQNKELVEKLEQEMRVFAKKLEFEHAQEVKEQIRNLRHLNEKQKMDLPKSYDQNIINSLVFDNIMHIQVFQIKHGVVSGRREFKVNQSLDSFESFMKQYYFIYSIPKEIIIAQELPDREDIEAYLSHIKNERVVITVPKKGYKKDLLEMVRKNIELKLTDEPLQELKKTLSLPKLPYEIDCFDISNISGTYATGSCVRFSQGKPNKHLYRHFKIKTVHGINDFAMMNEVVSRRYRDQLNIPDLIVIDGGRGQLNIALGVIHGLKLDVAVISLAKRLEEVYTENNDIPIRIPETSYALKLLQQIRDESHRFAITYHRKLREKGMTK